MNIIALQNRSYLGNYPQISTLNNANTKTAAAEKKLNNTSTSSKPKGFSWSDIY